MLRPSIALYLAALALPGCGDSTGAPADGPRLLSVTIGDTVSGHLVAGEIDSFSFTSPENGVGAVFLQAVDQNIVEARVLEYNYPVQASYTATSLVANRTPHFPLAAGQPLRLYVRPGLQAAERHIAGRYRFVVMRVNTDPEVVSPTLPADSVVSGETLSNSADIDTWIVPGFADTLGLMLVFGLNAPAPGTPISASLGPGVFTPLLNPGDTTTVTSGMISTQFPENWNISVRGELPPPFSASPPLFPSYRVGTRLVDLRPEHRAALIALADSTTVELIDSLNDQDTYKLQPDMNGRLLAAYLLTFGIPGDTLQLTVGTGENLGVIRSAAGDTALLAQGVGPFTVANGFTARVRAVHQAQPGLMPSYRFTLLAADETPESTLASLTLGDTVATEWLDHPADVDMFTFPATAGQAITATMEVPATFGTPLHMHILIPGSQNVYTVVATPGNPLGAAVLGFMAEATGTYQVYIRNEQGNRGHGPYRFVVW